MKKFIIFLIAIILIICAFFLFFGKFNIKKNKSNNTIPFKESHFYKNYFNTNDVLIINVWSKGSGTLIEQLPEFTKFQEENDLKYVTFSTESDSILLNKYLSNNKLLKGSDITLLNLGSRDSIFNSIGISGLNNGSSFIKINANITPYIAIIKDKKIIYKANEYNLLKIEEALKK